MAPYGGWQKSLYGVEWFDSASERAVANIVDDSADVACWVRLQTGDMTILWRSDGREYNPDFVVVETDIDQATRSWPALRQLGS